MLLDFNIMIPYDTMAKSAFLGHSPEPQNVWLHVHLVTMHFISPRTTVPFKAKIATLYYIESFFFARTVKYQVDMIERSDENSGNRFDKTNRIHLSQCVHYFVYTSSDCNIGT